MIRKITALLMAAVLLCSFAGCAFPFTLPEEEEETTTEIQETTEKKTEPSEVFFTADISPEGLMKIYEALDFKAKGKIAIKLSTGESERSYYLRPELIKDLVQSLDGTIVECNTAYSGNRSSTAMHKLVAKQRGFTDIAPFDLMDEEGEVSIPVKGGTILKENFVGKHFMNYDSMVVLSHFKGHIMAGYGGAMKNISIGIASQRGKCLIHSAGKSEITIYGFDQIPFQRSMAEAAKSVSDHFDNGKNIVYINVMNNLSIDCDCEGDPTPPEMADVGIFASTDPVAVDQACIDRVYAQKDGDAKTLVERIESLHGLEILSHAEKIGLGTKEYSLTVID